MKSPLRYCIVLATTLTLLASAGRAVAATDYLYALVDVTGSSNRLYGFGVDAATGALTLLAGFPFPTKDNGDIFSGTERLAYDAVQKRLYVINDQPDGPSFADYVSAHSVNLTTGELTLVPGPGLPDGAWDCLKVHPGGSPLVVGDGGAGSVGPGRLASFNEPSSSAALGSPYSAGTGVFSCAFSQNGAFVYAGAQGFDPTVGGPTTAGFSVNAGTGVLTPLPGSPYALGALAGLATDSAGRLFAAAPFGGLLRAFTTSAGVPTPVTGSPFSSGLGFAPHGVLHPAGFYMVADFTNSQVGVYQVVGSGAATTLVQVPGSPFPSGGTGTRVLALSQNGAFLFAANSNGPPNVTGNNNITTFAVDATTGHLTSLGTQPVSTLGVNGTVTGLAFVPQAVTPVAPPSIAKVFEAAAIPLGGSTSLTFTLANPNATTLTGVSFSDTLPAGLVVATPNGLTGSCGDGTVTAVAGSSSIALAGGTLAASTGCSFSVAITGITVGLKNNTTGNVTSTGGGTGGTASASLTVQSPFAVLVTGAGPGGGPHVEVFSGNGSLPQSFFAYDPAFRGGVTVAVGDVNGDGIPDVVTGAGPGGGPHVKVFDGATGNAIMSFFAYNPAFTGGVFVAVGDVNGDGFADIITGAGGGGGPHVQVFSGRDGSLLQSFVAYAPGFTGGVRVAAGDVNGDGKADIITGAGPGGGPHVKVFDGATGGELMSFFAYDAGFTGGVFVAAGDVNGDGKADIITGAGPGGGPHVKVFDGATGGELMSFFAYQCDLTACFTGGVFVGGGQ